MNEFYPPAHGYIFDAAIYPIYFFRDISSETLFISLIVKCWMDDAENKQSQDLIILCI